MKDKSDPGGKAKKVNVETKIIKKCKRLMIELIKGEMDDHSHDLPTLRTVYFILQGRRR